MANIDTIQAFADKKQRFGYLKNDYFLVAGVMYYKSIDYPIAVWDYKSIDGYPHPCAYINGERRGNDHSIATYVANELSRRGVVTEMTSLQEVKQLIEAK